MKKHLFTKILCLFLVACTLVLTVPPAAVLAIQDMVAATSEAAKEAEEGVSSAEPSLEETPTGDAGTQEDPKIPGVTGDGEDTTPEGEVPPPALGPTGEEIILPEDYNADVDGTTGPVILTPDNFRLRMNTDLSSYTLLQYIGVKAEVTVPAYYDGLPITRIADSAFWGNTALVKVTLPESITSVGAQVFDGCTSLTYNVVDGGKYIESPTNPTFYFAGPVDTGVTEFTVHENTVLVGAHAFKGCADLLSVSFPDGIRHMGFGVLFGCEKIETLALPFLGETGHSTRNAHLGWIFGSRTYGGHISYLPEGIRHLSVSGGTVITRAALYGLEKLESLSVPFLGETKTDAKNAYLSFLFGGATYQDNVMPATLVSVSVSSGIIGEGAFYQDTALQTVSLGEEVTEVGAYAFYNCTGLESVNIPGKVSSISDYSFYNCTALLSVSMEEGITHIGEYAFYGCASIPEIILPDSVISIGFRSFYFCSSIEFLHIGKGVEQIANEAFLSCLKITSIQFNAASMIDLSSDNDVFSSAGKNSNGIVVTIGSSVASIPAFLFSPSPYSSYAPNIQKVIFEDASVCASIGAHAFDSCENLTQITIPSSLKCIDQWAFIGCSKLSDVYITDISSWLKITFGNDYSYPTYYGNLHVLDSEGFELSEIVVPDNITEIPNYAFKGCPALVFSIPNSVTKIGFQAFYKTGLYNNADNWKNDVLYIGKHLITANPLLSGSYTISEGTVCIADSAFAGCNKLTSVSVPDSVVRIGENAFSGCSSLLSITLPFVGSSRDAAEDSAIFGAIFGHKLYSGGISSSDVQNGYCIPVSLTEVIITGGTLHDNSFSGCEYLSNIVLKDNVTRIGHRAFFKCTGLNSITIGNGITSIGDEAFYNCSGLTSIAIPDSVTSIGDKAFYNCSGLTSIAIPDGVTGIGDEAFYNCSGLTSIAIPGSVTSIGWDVFSSCSKLTSATIGKGITSIGVRMFANCSSLTSVTIGKGVSSIGMSAFYNCSMLTALSLPDSVTTISDYAFYNCTSLASITIPDSVKTIGEMAFANCVSLSFLTIGKGVESIGDRAFENCTGLTEIHFNAKSLQDLSSDNFVFLNAGKNADGITVIIGNSVQKIPAYLFCPRSASSYNPNVKVLVFEENSVCINIGDSAFYLCNELETITFGSNIASIGDSAFSNCKSLTSIVIPDSVTNIGNSAFANCTSLVSIGMGKNVSSIGLGAFRDCSSLTSMVVPSSVASIGSSAFSGCKSLHTVTIENAAIAGTVTYDFSYGNLCYYAKTIRISTGITQIGRYITNNFPYKSIETINGADYTVYSQTAPGSIYLEEDTSTIFLEKASTPHLPSKEETVSIQSFSINILAPLSSGIYTGTCGDELTWSLDISTGTLTISGNGEMDNYPYQNAPWGNYRSYIKEVIIGNGVTSIGERAFYCCINLLSVTIGNSVVLINNSAFFSCTSLSSITLSNKITSIGSYAFSGCNNLSSIIIPDSVVSIGERAFYMCENLTTAIIGNGTKSIGDEAFYECNKLTSIELGTNLKSIGFRAFYYCYNLAAINLPSGLTSIGAEAFYYCKSITSIRLPASVATIEEGAFALCYALTNIEVADGNSFYKTVNGNLYSQDGKTLIQYIVAKNETSFLIPDGVTKIGNYAFYGCNKLVSISFSDSVTDIGDYAFGNCQYLANVTLSNNITSIGSHAFYMCRKLSSISLPSNLLSIGNGAFNSCSSLTAITLPKGLLRIGENAFYSCSKLSSIYLPDTVTYIGKNAFSGTNYQATASNWEDDVLYIGNFLLEAKKTLSGEYTIKDGTKMIAISAFEKCHSLTAVILSNSIERIGDYAFYDCIALSSVVFGGNVENIGQYAFSKCTALTDAIIPNSVTVLEAYAFANCTALASVALGNSLTRIGNHAFSGCSSLTSIVISQSLTNIEENAFYNCSLSDVYVTDITAWLKITYGDDSYSHPSYFGKLHFLGSLGDELTSITIPDGIAAIPDFAFRGSSLSSILIPQSVKSIGTAAFSGCTKLSSIIIPDNITVIGNNAFSNCTSLTSIAIGKGVRNIEFAAFNNCNRLSKVYITDLAAWCEIAFSFYDANPVYYAKNLYVNDALATDLIIPSSVTSIKDYAFICCSSINSIKLPDSIVSIGKSAFDNCSNLSSITIPDGVTCIGSEAFYNCRKLSVATIGAGITSIGQEAFYYCNRISEITIPINTTSIGNYAFYYCSNLKEIYFNAANLEDLTASNYVFHSAGKSTDGITVTIGKDVERIPANLFNATNSTSYAPKIKEVIFEEGTSCTSIGSGAFAYCQSLATVSYPGDKHEWRHIKRAVDWDKNAGAYTMEYGKEVTLLYEADDTLTNFYVAGYIGKDGDLRVPERYSSRWVVYVYSGAFQGNETLRTAYLPDSIAAIGANAFKNCKNLEEVRLPEALQSIEFGIFTGCESMERITVPFLGAIPAFEEDETLGYLFGGYSAEDHGAMIPNALREVTVVYATAIAKECFADCAGLTGIHLPSTVTAIGADAFRGCAALGSFTVPAEVKTVGDYAFADCMGLTAFRFPDKTTAVGVGVLSGCFNLRSLTIGKNLVSIGDYQTDAPLFGMDKSRSRLEKYVVDPENPLFASDEYGVLYHKMEIPYEGGAETLLVGVIDAPAAANLSGYRIPTHTVMIGAYAFAYNKNIQVVDLSYVRQVGKCAFLEAKLLNSVAFGNPTVVDLPFENTVATVTYSQTVGDMAFMGCSSLQAVNIGSEMLLALGEMAFYDCPMLKSVELGKNLTEIGLDAFGGESNLENFWVDGENPRYTSLYGVLYSMAGDALTLEIFPACLVRCDEAGNALTNLEGHFGKRVPVLEFSLPADRTVSAIQTNAFRGAKHLEKLTLSPTSPLRIGDYAFAESRIQNVILGENVISLGLLRGEGEYTVFADCLYLTDVTVSPENPYYSSVSGVLFNKAQTTLLKYPAAKVGYLYTLPVSVRVIASGAFRYNKNLVYITVPTTLDTVGLEAFYGCSGLSLLFFQDAYAPTTVMENAFTTNLDVNGIAHRVPIGYSAECYEDGQNGEVGWSRYEDVYQIIPWEKIPALDPDMDFPYYAIVVVDEKGQALRDVVVSLTDPYGKTETVLTGKTDSGRDAAVFYDLFGKEGVGFSLDTSAPYTLRVAETSGTYYIYETSALYLDAEMRITYVTLIRKPCDLSFHANGGVGEAAMMDVEVGFRYEIPTDAFTRPGYTFLGWSTEPEGKKQYFDAFLPGEYKAHYVLYAVWEANENTLRFDLNGADGGAMAEIKVHTDEQISLPVCNFVKAGYTFVGWATDPALSATFTDGGNYTGTPGSVQTLYAKWVGNSGVVVFHAQGGTGVMAEQTLATGDTVPICAFTRAGYTFSHWVTATGRIFHAGDAFVATTDLVQPLYAVWTANENTIRFDANGGSGSMAQVKGTTDSTISLPRNEFTKKGCVLLGWSNKKNSQTITCLSQGQYTVSPAGEQTLYAVWGKGPTAVGVSCGSMDINTQNAKLNKQEFDYYEAKIDNAGNITYGDLIRESVEIKVVGYCDVSTGYTFLPAGCGLYQNGKQIASVSSYAHRDGATEFIFSVPVYTLAVDTDIEVRLTVENAVGERASCATVLNIDVFDFTVSGDDVNLETEDLNVDLAGMSGLLATFLGSNSFNFSIGKNVKFSGVIDGDTVTLSLVGSKEIERSNSKGYSSYEEGYRANMSGSVTNTFFFQFHAPVKIGGHTLTYNVRVARGEPGDEYFYYRCYIYKDGNYDDEVTTFYGAFNKTDFIGGGKKDLRSTIAPKAQIVYVNHYGYALKAGSLEKIKNLPGEAQYTETKRTIPGTDSQTSNSFNFGLEGNLVFQYDLQQLRIQPVSSKIYGYLEYSFTHNQQFVVWLIPITLDIGVDLKGNATVKLKFEPDWKPDMEQLRVQLDATIKAYAGAGISIASFGVYGSIGALFIMDFAPKVEVNTLKVNGTIGVRGKFLWWMKERELASFDRYFIGSPESAQAATFAMLAMPELYLVENYTLATAEELENDFRLLVVGDTLYKISYVDASSLEGYDENNYAKLAISAWDGTAWTSPILLDDNGRADAAYTLYREGDRVFLVYTQQTKFLEGGNMDSKADVYEAAADLAIKVVELSEEALSTGSFQVTQAVERSHYTYSTQYALINGTPTLVWAENADNNVFGVSPKNYIDNAGVSHVFATKANSIWYSRFENGAWSEPRCLAEGLSAITDLALGKDGSLAYLVDENGNLADTGDRVLYYTTSLTAIAAPLNDPALGAVLRVDAEKEGFLYYYDATENETEADGLRILVPTGKNTMQTLPDEAVEEFVSLRDKDGLLFGILYAKTASWEENGESVSGSVLYAIFAEDGAWGDPVPVGVYQPQGDTYVTFYDAVLAQDGKSVALYLTLADATGASLGTQTLTFQMEAKLKAEEYEIHYTEGTVSVTVTNVGAMATAVYVSINGEGYMKIANRLASGESAVFEIPLPQSADLMYELAFAEDAKGLDAAILSQVDLNHSDLVPLVKQLLLGEKDTLLLAIRNNGNLANTGIAVIRLGNVPTEELLSEEVLLALEGAVLAEGVPTLIRFQNAKGEAESFWAVKATVAKSAIVYYEIPLSEHEAFDEACVVSIGLLPLDGALEKGDATENNFCYHSYEHSLGVLEEEERVETVTKLNKTFLSFDKKVPLDITLGFVCADGNTVAALTLDGMLLEESAYIAAAEGISGALTLSGAWLATLAGGTYTLTARFADGTEAKATLAVAAYYTATWLDGEGILHQIEFREGEMPNFPGEDPKKAATEVYTYVFDGWDRDGDGLADSPCALEADTTFVALYREIPAEYLVIFLFQDADGSPVTAEETYRYGDLPAFLGEAPAPAGMRFAGWEQEILPVTGDVTYTARYESLRLRGDLNGDGIVNTRDLGLLRQHVVGIITLSEEELSAANIYEDYDAEGVAIINTRDVGALQQYIVGIVDSL